MVTLSHALTICATVLCVTLVLVMPTAAINTAIYGDTAGFIPALHQDTFAVACTLPGNAGVELDTGYLVLYQCVHGRPLHRGGRRVKPGYRNKTCSGRKRR